MGPRIVQHDNLDKTPQGAAHDSAPWAAGPRVLLDWRGLAVLCGFLLAAGVLLYAVFGGDIRAWLQDHSWIVWAALALLVPFMVKRLLLITQPGGYKTFFWQVNGHEVTRGMGATMLAYARRELANAAQVTLTNPPAAQAKKDEPRNEVVAPLASITPESDWLAWTDLAPHLMVAGRTDSGKTTTVEAVLARRILAGDLVLVIDPHYQAGKWLGAAAIGGGRDYAACYQAFDATRALLDRRYQAFDAGTRTENYKRITIVVDEVPAIISYAQSRDKALYDRWLLFANSLGSEARKVRISIILLTQSPLVRDIGISSAMRENFTRIALGDTAADLLREEPNAEHKQSLLDLLRGRPYPAAMEYRNNWYALRNDDIPALARTNGTTPRAPTLLLPGAPPVQRGLPPTQRAAPRAVPPTDPLPPPTVQDEILLLLSGQGAWLTASEIAAKLGADLAVVRTEIDTLYNKSGKLTRRGVRGKTTKEKYEYQVQSVQSVQPRFTPTA